MRITSKGQITIPQAIREQLGLLPETEVEFQVKGNAVQIVKSGRSRSRGDKVVRNLRGSATTKLTTDQIMSLTRG
jgi:AbrB family looped-hinge helix DNA binding protein